MTIAVCFVSHEGIVLGADSTSTIMQNGRPVQHFDHQQKIFEVGEGATLGVTMWGVGSLPHKSHRTLIAELADELRDHPPATVEEAARRLATRFWGEFTTGFAQHIARFAALTAQGSRTPQEEQELEVLSNLTGGFCIGGRVPQNREPQAFSVVYAPGLAAPQVERLDNDVPYFWGIPNLLNRLIFGIDEGVFDAIVSSGKWNGTPQELFSIVSNAKLRVPGTMPLREAIDWVYSSILITIKAIKFSNLPPLCGGPVELAVITSDRNFRWVKHKRLDEAVVRHHSG